MNILTRRQIIMLHTQLIQQSGGSDGIRDEGMLDSAINQPFQTFTEVPVRARIIVHGLRLTTFLHWDRYAVPVEKPPAGFTT